MRTTREGLRLDVARRRRRDVGLARLAQLFVERGPPTFLRSANGPACTATAVRDWLHRVGGTTRFIEPGRPWANGSGESFNGKLRDACLNRERFDTLLEAQILIKGWRREDNPIRPHRALGSRPPAPETQQPRERPMTRVPAIGLTLTTGTTIGGRSAVAVTGGTTRSTSMRSVLQFSCSSTIIACSLRRGAAQHRAALSYPTTVRRQ